MVPELVAVTVPALPPVPPWPPKVISPPLPEEPPWPPTDCTRMPAPPPLELTVMLPELLTEAVPEKPPVPPLPPPPKVPLPPSPPMPPVAWDSRPMAPRELEVLVTVMLVPA